MYRLKPELSIETREDALKAIKVGAFTGYFLAFIQAGDGLGAIVWHESVAGASMAYTGPSLWNLVNALVMAGLTYGLHYKQSRVAAVLLLVDFLGMGVFNVVQRVYAEQEVSVGGDLDTIFFLLIAFLLAQGIRGSIAYYRMSAKDEQSTELSE